MNKRHYDPFKDGAPKHAHFGRDDKDDRLNDDKTADTHAQETTGAEGIEPEDSFQEAEDTARIESEANTPSIREYKPSRKNKYPISALVSAGFWIRFVALSIDLVVAYAFSAIFASPIIALAAKTQGIFPAAVKGIFFYLYFVLFTYFTNGQTLGKMMTSIRVIHPDEERLSFTTVLVREGFCRLIQTTFSILYLITPFTERKRNIGDFLADTYVVKDQLYTIERERGDIFYAYGA
ncbi:MAG: RDD family protein [Peptoniphilus sp.]|nr:RDD family protein [Peptoniphilus sp.]MDY6045169.1 RDD family protein [Peptoniphilus sp.]